MRDSKIAGELIARLEDVPSRRFIASQLIWFIIWFLVTGAALFVTPHGEGHGTHTRLGLPACPSVQMFDRPCPGCGLTTSFAWTVRGEIPKAMKANMMGPLMYLIFTVSAWMGLYGWLKTRRWMVGTATHWFLVAFAAGFVTHGILRFALVKYNSPFYTMGKLFHSDVSEESGDSSGVPKTDPPAKAP